MNQVAPDIWTRLALAPPSGERLTARVAIPERSSDVLCAINSEFQRYCLIPISASARAVRDTQSRGLFIETKELGLEAETIRRYLVLACKDPGGYALFDLIVSEIVEHISSKNASPSEVVERVLAKWRRFWSNLPRRLLSIEEQIGLFGELWFIADWMVPQLGCRQTINRWRGPFGARHDFEWPGRSVEVKTTTSVHELKHYVNGADQLSAPENGDLFLFSLRISEEAGASNTLSGLVSECRNRFASDDDALSLFESALTQTGYFATHDEDYGKVRYRVVEQGLYQVSGRFPRITADSFTNGIPDGVGTLQYSINLTGFADLRVAQSGDQVSWK